jgi:DNA topoisomerase-1
VENNTIYYPMEEIVQLSHNEFLKIDKDYVSSAKAAELVYVSDKDEGIQLIKKGTSFSYIYNNQPVKDEKQLERIRKLAIPPAWTNVWICPKENGHI